MHTHRPPDIALWYHDRALREPWRHEDKVVAQRMGWLIGSDGLMFTACAMCLLALLRRLPD